ncbi:MAG: response regulator [Polyangiales bacterium]|nr:response regulator [Myxococcales bacterium]
MAGNSSNRAPGQRLSILLVDDEPFVLRALQRILRDHDVRTAQSCEEAIPLLRERAPDLLVTDNAMPGCGGAELLRLSRELCPSAVRVMLSATPPDETPALIAEGIVERVLEKPWGPDIGVILIATFQNARR